MIIAIDGPAASGKSSVAKQVAERLGFFYLDTGAFYRALTLAALKRKVHLKDKKALLKLAKEVKIALKKKGDSFLVMLDQCDVTLPIRAPEVTSKVHYVARLVEVRKEMHKLQRRITKGKPAVIEGRDIGTVVFPHADKKFYLDALFEVRAKRRYKELKERRKETGLERVKKEIKQRDEKDIRRKVHPLRQARDALYLDTTNLSINEVVDRIVKECRI